MTDTEWTTIICHTCGMEFCTRAAWASTRRQGHKTFYCPDGHSLAFNGPTEAEKLRTRLGVVEAGLRDKDRSIATLRRKLARLNKPSK